MISRIDKITQMMESIAAAVQELTASMDEIATVMTNDAKTATDILKLLQKNSYRW